MQLDLGRNPVELFLACALSRFVFMHDSKRNFKLTIEYDGTNYHGWQIQPNEPSIQQTIESALMQMTRQKIRLSGSGRTDAGVHALGQVASFTCDTMITPDEFHKGLNSILPDDIVIREVKEMPIRFHARYDAKYKRYRYTILNQPLPSAIQRHYAWWIRTPLDLSAMEKATAHIIGEHDFKAFEGAGSPRAHTIRHVTELDINGHPIGPITIDIRADGFLRYMVRNIVGTLVDVGLGKISPQQVQQIIASKDRSLAAATAPARGLFLMEVCYVQ
jgi:tRNA pseudouridine38-40 synthase